MNDFERLNHILKYLSTQPQGDYVLDYCVIEFGGYWANYFELVVQLLLDGYAEANEGDLQFLYLTPEGETFLRQGGYPVPLREKTEPELAASFSKRIIVSEKKSRGQQ